MGPMVNGSHVASTCNPLVTCSAEGYGGGGRDTEVKEATTDTAADAAVVGRRKFLFTPPPFVGLSERTIKNGRRLREFNA